MASQVRLTTTVARVLQVFLDDVTEPRYGFDLMQVLELPSGTLYPILARLERAGWIVGRREDADPAEVGRSARRMYLLTPDGAELADSALKALKRQFRVRPTRSRVPRPAEGPA